MVVEMEVRQAAVETVMCSRSAVLLVFLPCLQCLFLQLLSVQSWLCQHPLTSDDSQCHHHELQPPTPFAPPTPPATSVSSLLLLYLLFLSIVAAAICSRISLSLLISFLSAVSVVEQIVSLFCLPMHWLTDQLTGSDIRWWRDRKRGAGGGGDNVMWVEKKRLIALKRIRWSSVMELNSFDSRIWSNFFQGVEI